MPKTNQIPFLTPSHQQPGATYHWKPSPRLRKAGWTNLTLGQDWGVAVQLAIGRNADVAAFERRQASCPERSRGAPATIRRWSDLVRAYQADPAFLDLKPSSQAEYASRIRALTIWALDGQMQLRDLDRAMLVDLRNTLVRDPRKHRTAALLRVLRVLVNFAAGQGWLPRGLADGLDIPEAPSRTTIIAPADVERLAARAEAEGQPALALAIRLGFWTFQRESDLLALTRFNWRPCTDMSAFARSVLAGPDGSVMGLRIQQRKTDAWVHVPLIPPLRAAVDARLAALDASAAHLLSCAAGGGQWPQWAFQRAFRGIAEAEGMSEVQFRDFRRSGMVLFGELAVELQLITSISGHAVLGNKRTILDTYMPASSRFACEGVATAWSRWCERIAQEQVK